MTEQQKELHYLLIQMSSNEIAPVFEQILDDYADSVGEDTARLIQHLMRYMKSRKMIQRVENGEVK